MASFVPNETFAYIALSMLALWKLPIWGRRVLAFSRDLRRFRGESHQRSKRRNLWPSALQAPLANLRPDMADETEETFEPLAREGEHMAPVLDGEAFHCMHCGVLAQQSWYQLGTDRSYVQWKRCICRNCNGVSIWSMADRRSVDPVVGGGPRPHIEMPEDVKADYEEARRIVGLSPRGACALLRLCVQKLCQDLGEKGKDINEDIASLVRKGLPQEAQEALDAVRVIGNEAVHPGELDLTDDIDTASALFDLLNFVVEDQIAEPKKRRAIFRKVPQGKRDAIEKRNAKAKQAAAGGN